MDRITLGRMQNPIRGFLHGGAAVASLIGLIVLVIRTWDTANARLGALVFGLSLILMYTTSSLYHSIPWSGVWKLRMQRLDHSMIFLVVAGTFTPVAIASLDGANQAIALGTVWGLATLGIVLKTVLTRPATWLSVTIQLAMGWSTVFWMPEFYRQLGAGAVILLALGGLCYTVGVVVFVSKRPRMFPRIFSYHELFHVLVVTASALHFLAILLYAIPGTV
ncbi:MAG: hemolysin III family protein [Acidimicrobiia bacterium]